MRRTSFSLRQPPRSTLSAYCSARPFFHLARLTRFSSYWDSVMPTMLTWAVDESHSHLLYLKMDCLLVAVSSVNLVVALDVVVVVVVELLLELELELELELLLELVLLVELELEVFFSQKFFWVDDFLVMLSLKLFSIFSVAPDCAFLSPSLLFAFLHFLAFLLSLIFLQFFVFQLFLLFFIFLDLFARHFLPLLPFLHFLSSH